MYTKALDNVQWGLAWRGESGPVLGAAGLRRMLTASAHGKFQDHPDPPHPHPRN